MAKVDAPAFSLGASGTVADTITFSRWKGRIYVRRRVIPANPKSPAQTGMRAALRWASRRWASLTSTQQATWQDDAEQRAISPFNAFISQAQRNVRDGKMPQRESPAEVVTAPGAPASPSATASNNYITLGWTNSTTGNIWGTAIYRSKTSGFTPDRTNLIALVNDDVNQYVDGPLQAGTYYYKIIHFSAAGELGTPSSELSATV